MLKNNIPAQANAPMIIFYRPILSSLSFTLEQNTATRMTDNKLQDLTITTAGKDA